MTLAGADILIYPTAIGWDPDDSADEQARQLDAWLTVQRAHAIANGVPVLVCNRTGYEPDPGGHTAGIHFWGSSFVCGPQGEVLARAGADEARILPARIDLRRTEEVRRIWPYLRDRRIDAYADLRQRFIDNPKAGDGPET
jgi:N-carbamoylputrescine amidase